VTVVVEKQAPLLLSWWNLRREPMKLLLWTALVPAMSCGQDTSPPSPKPARDVVEGGGDDDRILNLLRQAVDKTEYTANSVARPPTSALLCRHGVSWVTPSSVVPAQTLLGAS